MNITQNDFSEINTLNEIILKIDDIDADYVLKTSEELNAYQPFMLSMLLGYSLDVSPEELEEIMKIYFVIWEHFKDRKNIKNIKFTERQFDKIQNKNIRMLTYLEGESDTKKRQEIISADLDNLASKALITGIFYRFNTQKAFIEMNEKTKSIILIGIKSLIGCFDEIS